MSYLEDIFTGHIEKEDVKVIFELGSRDLIDAFKLQRYYNAKVYSFECNPDCIVECEKNLAAAGLIEQENIILTKKAISIDDGPITFYPFDLTKYNNMGASSLLKIDFSKRGVTDPDYNLACPQHEITVTGTRLDTFMIENNISTIDMLCIDLQGYELNAIKSLGENLHKVKYIITECSIQNTYTNGTTFEELNQYLSRFNFSYMCSSEFLHRFPDMNRAGMCEFDALFMNQAL